MSSSSSEISRLPFLGFFPLDVSSPAVGDFLRSGRCRCVRCKHIVNMIDYELIYNSTIQCKLIENKQRKVIEINTRKIPKLNTANTVITCYGADP